MATYTGTSGNDAASYGGTSNDMMSGRAGNDSLNAGDGQDVVYGGTGDDSVDGGAGNDTVYGDDGNDTVTGGWGNDFVSGGAGNDHLDLGDGDDKGSSGTGNDTAYGGAGNDAVWGENGRDQVFGGSGADTLFGGADGDTLDGGDDGDRLYGGAGADSQRGGAGNDTIYGDIVQATLTASSGSASGTGQVVNQANFAVDLFRINENGRPVFLATIQPGGSYSGPTATSFNFVLTETGTPNQLAFFPGSASGPFYSYSADLNDTIDGGAGDDMISGDAGADILYGGTGNDTAAGGNEADSIYGGDGHDLLSGDAGNDRLSGDAGNDTLGGGVGADTLYGGAGDDHLSGDAGNDALFGGVGDDVLAGGIGDDALAGDAGNDTLISGAGSDTLSGGAGDDQFRFETASGGDTISDFDLGDADANGFTNDRLDVSDLRTANNQPVKAFDVVVRDDGHCNAVLNFPGGESVVLQGVSPAMAGRRGMLHAMGVPCIVAGTQIATPLGLRAVQDIAVGDLVLTAAGGAVPVIWHGCRDFGPNDLARQPGAVPIRFAAGAIGNTTALYLSPQHAVCVPGVPDVLIRARHFAQYGSGARPAFGKKNVTYHHLMLPQHDILLAVGARVESFYPGKIAVAGLTPLARLALIRVVLALPDRPGQFSTLADIYGARCQRLASSQEASACLRTISGNRDASVSDSRSFRLAQNTQPLQSKAVSLRLLFQQAFRRQL